MNIKIIIFTEWFHTYHAVCQGHLSRHDSMIYNKGKCLLITVYSALKYPQKA